MLIACKAASGKYQLKLGVGNKEPNQNSKVCSMSSELIYLYSSGSTFC